MRVLITGASGFVGGHLLTELSRRGLETTGLFRRRPAPAGKHILQCDMTDADRLSAVISAERPDLIVHAAAAANSSYCELNPAAAAADNVTATQNLCRAALTAVTPIPVIHLSTDLVFDDYESAPAGGFTEADQPRARTVYGKTKLEAEDRLLELLPNSIVFRTSLVYGPPSIGAAGMMGWLIGALRQEKSVTLFTDEWRTPVYVGDIAEAVAASVSLGYMKKMASTSKVERTIQLAGPERISRYRFGQIAAEVYGFSPALLRPSTRADFIQSNRDVPHRPADVSLSIRRLTGRLRIAPRSVLEGLKASAAAEYCPV